MLRIAVSIPSNTLRRLSALMLRRASFFSTTLVSFSKGQVIAATSSAHDFAVLDPHDAVGQLGDFVVVGDHHDVVLGNS